jgi:hypothetical protein
MRKNVFKAFAFLIGASMVISSCVKTEELESVKAIREAKAASLLAGAKYTEAQTQIELANLAVIKFNKWMDSVQLVANLEDHTIQTQIAAANAEVTIERAKNQLAKDLLQAQIDQKNLQNQITALLKTNPALALLVQDYNSYYYGGNQSTGVYIQQGIFSLRSEMLNIQSEIVALKANQADAAYNKLNTLSSYNSKLAQDSAAYKGLQKQLDLLKSSKSTSIDAAIVTAKAQESTAYANYQAKLVIYNTTSTAFQTVNDTKSDYFTAIKDSANAASDIYTILQPYENDINQFNQAIVRQLNTVNADKKTLDQLTKDFTDTTKNLNVAQDAYNAAKVIRDAAQATVDAANVNGSATADQQTALSNADKVLSAASKRLTYVQLQYNLLYVEIYGGWANGKSYIGANVTYTNNLSALKAMQTNLTKYNNDKILLDATVAKLPALRTDYYAKQKANNDAYRAYTLASIANTYAQSAVSILESSLTKDSSPYSSLENNITNTTIQINKVKEDITADKLKIANIDITSANNFAAEITAKTNQIAELQAILDSYTTKAATLKAEIDAAK